MTYDISLLYYGMIYKEVETLVYWNSQNRRDNLSNGFIEKSESLSFAMINKEKIEKRKGLYAYLFKISNLHVLLKHTFAKKMKWIFFCKWNEKKKISVGISLQSFKPSCAFKSSKHSCAYNIGINCWKKKVHQLFKLTNFRSYAFHVCLTNRTLYFFFYKPHYVCVNHEWLHKSLCTCG